MKPMGLREAFQSNRLAVVAGAVLVAASIAFSVLIWRGPSGFGGSGQTTPTIITPSATPQTPSVTPSTPSPEPTFRCSTARGASCTKELADKEAARDQAYSDAREAYRAYDELRASLVRENGARKLPDDLDKIVGPDVAAGIQATVDATRERNWALYGNSVLSFSLDKNAPEWPTNELSLLVCSDDTKLTMLNRKTGTIEQRGSVNLITAEMRKEAGTWKTWGIPNLAKVDKCPAGFE